MLDFLFGLVNGLALAWVILSRRGWLTRPNPYQYVCFKEGCQFKASANNMEILLGIANGHDQFHQDDHS